MLSVARDSGFATSFLVVVVLLLIIWVVVYIIRNVMYGTFTTVTLVTSQVPINGNTFQVVASNMPAAVNGNDYTYAFWMKLMDFSLTNYHKLIWYRSASPDNMAGCPLCMLDRGTNRLYFLLSTNQTSATLTRNDVVGKEIDQLRSDNSMAVVSLDYVPMSRWTHLGIIVRDRYVTLTVDGEVYANGTVSTFVGGNTGAVISPASGTIYIGGESTVDGLITRMQFANYATSLDDMRNMYLAGPSHSMMGIGGLNIPTYGLRWPVYRLG